MRAPARILPPSPCMRAHAHTSRALAGVCPEIVLSTLVFRRDVRRPALMSRLQLRCASNRGETRHAEMHATIKS